MAVDDGLIVPVIHDAAALGLGQIAARRAELVTKAQAGKLALADLEGGTFTLSNLGMYGVDVFNAIVNPPQVAILSVGSVQPQPRAVGAEIVIRRAATFTLGADHRVVDGRQSARFLEQLKTELEAWA